MNLRTKITSAVMALAICLTTVGCTQKADTSFIATVGEQQIPAGIYLFSMMSAYNAAVAQLEDPKENVLKATIEEKTGSDWILDDTMNSLNKYIASELLFDELGLTLTPKQMEMIDEQVVAGKDNYIEEFKLLSKNGISEKSYAKIIANQYKLSEIFPVYYGEKGVEPVKEEEYKTQFESDYRRAIIMSFALNDPTGQPLNEANKKAVEDKATELFDKLNKGSDLTEVYGEYKIFTAQQANQTPAENLVPPTSSLIEVNNVNLPEGFIAELDKAKEDDYIKVANDKFILIAKKKNLYEKMEDFESMKENLLYALKTDDFNKLIETKANELGDKVVYNQEALSRYTPNKVKAK